MGFFDALGKIVQGKPVYENPSLGATQPSGPTKTSRPHFGADGRKIIPRVVITRSTVTPNGQNMQIWARIRNQSDTNVRLQKITLLGTSRQIGNFLNPGEEEEIMIFNGPRPAHDNYDKAELYYILEETGDYFCTEHIIRYEYESDKTYTVKQFEPYNYTRDV